MSESRRTSLETLAAELKRRADWNVSKMHQHLLCAQDDEDEACEQVEHYMSRALRLFSVRERVLASLGCPAELAQAAA